MTDPFDVAASLTANRLRACLVDTPQLAQARQQRPSWTEEWHGAVPVPCRWARSFTYAVGMDECTEVDGFALTEAEKEWEGPRGPYRRYDDTC